jgi:hypothetical protein
VRWRLFQTAAKIVHNGQQTSGKISAARLDVFRHYSRALRASRGIETQFKNIPIAGAAFSRARWGDEPPSGEPRPNAENAGASRSNRHRRRAGGIGNE